jgi:HK97 family phage portal protein
MSTSTIARVFGVPPWRIGASGGDSMTYSNVESQDLAFAKHTLRPWLVRIEQALKGDPDLFPSDSEYPEFLVDAMLRADSATRATVYAQGFGRWLTTNDIRRSENLAPLAGGDELVTPAATPPKNAA